MVGSVKTCPSALGCTLGFGQVFTDPPSLCWQVYTRLIESREKECLQNWFRLEGNVCNQCYIWRFEFFRLDFNQNQKYDVEFSTIYPPWKQTIFNFKIFSSTAWQSNSSRFDYKYKTNITKLRIRNQLWKNAWNPKSKKSQFLKQAKKSMKYDGLKYLMKKLQIKRKGIEMTWNVKAI